MNLLDYFVLQTFQISLLQGEVLRVAKEGAVQDAKMEMNLTPRLMESSSGDQLPSYQVSARLVCVGGVDKESNPAFKAKIGIETVYQQTSGEPIDIAEFSNNHASLSRQIYPLLAQELRGLLNRMGLTDVQLPFDLNPSSRKVNVTQEAVRDRVH